MKTVLAKVMKKILFIHSKRSTCFWRLIKWVLSLYLPAFLLVICPFYLSKQQIIRQDNPKWVEFLRGKLLPRKRQKSFQGWRKIFFISIYFIYFGERMTFLGFLDFGPHNEAIDQQAVLSFQTYRNNIYYIKMLW